MSVCLYITSACSTYTEIGIAIAKEINLRATNSIVRRFATTTRIISKLMLFLYSVFVISTAAHRNTLDVRCNNKCTI